MTNILGIIPAGGMSERFYGVYKELLPIGPSECGLTRCIYSMLSADANQIVIATTEERMKEQKRFVDPDDNCVFIWRRFDDLWEFISEIANAYPADVYYFAMPDTIYPIDVFERMPVDQPVCVGTFQTFQPERFGVIQDQSILDKQLELGDGIEPFTAWGVWSWSGDVMNVLVETLRYKQDHTKAFETIIRIFGYHKVEMEYYYDFASFEYYREYLCSIRTSKSTE